MSPERIDPSDALKKLFERRGSASRAAAPEALFQSSPGSSADAAAQKKSGSGSPGSNGGMLGGWGRKATQAVRLLAERFPLRGSPRGAVIGVDQGTAALKTVRLEPAADGRLRLTSATLHEWGVGAEGDLAREALFQEQMRVLRRQGRLDGAVVLGFHHRDMLVETIRLPKMPPEELDQAVLWEAKERLSVKTEQSVVRHIATGETTVEGQVQMDILVISLPKEPLLAYWRPLAEMGLKVAAVEPIGLAAFYPLEGLNLWKPTEVVGHLEIGMKMSHLNLIRGGTVRFSRTFQVAGDSVTKAIADYCQADYAAAEGMKLRHGISKMALEEDRRETGHASEDRVRVSHALGLHLEQLVAEIEHSFRYFAFELGGTDAQRMDRLLITGGGGLLKYLPEFLTSRLSVPVEVVDPLRGLQVDSKVQGELEAGWAQRLAVAVGLASRQVK